MKWKKSNGTNYWLAAMRTQGLGVVVMVVWNKDAEAVKGKMKSFYGVRTVQCLDCGGGYTNTKWKHCIETKACTNEYVKTRNI